MITEAARIAQSAANSLWVALQLLLISGIWFCGLALLVKGKKAIAAARSAAREVRVNLSWLLLDVLFVAPIIALLVTSIRFGIAHSPLRVIDEGVWALAGRGATFLAVVFLGDFVSYWRHRLEHTHWLWPAHAIHHSDTEVTWLTLARFHPVNRAVTASVDIAPLALLGFPAWALIANEILSHEVSRRLSPGVPADLGAGWFEGLAKRNRYALLARQTLWEQLAEYVGSLDDEQFRRALVFLRRRFPVAQAEPECFPAP